MTIVLGIETSCDETSASVLEDGLARSNVVASQVAVHAQHGGIVPEVASRQHVAHIGAVVTAAVREAGISWSDITAVAATNGPGLAGPLMVGLNAAKGLSAALGVPLLGVNHLAGHICAAWVRRPGFPAAAGPELQFPLMCLIASGGHTELVLMRGHGDFELVGQTRDDAAGEAFDKAARVLGLGYPGGPAVQKAAEGAPDTERLPRPLIPDTDDFSFSGLKTAVVRRARELGIYPVPRPGAERAAAALARAFQDAVADVLARKTSGAADRAGCGGVVLVGGVAANRALRARLAEESSVPVAAPHISLCTDNGAMIAMAGWQMYEAGLRPAAAPDVEPGLQVGPLWGVSAATVQRTG